MAAKRIVQITDRTVQIRTEREPAGAGISRELPQSSGRMAPETLAAVIGELFAESGMTAGRITLVIPSSWCYVHAFPMPRRRATPQMLDYALEEYLPVDVEQLTCDYLPVDSGRCIGVAVDTERMRVLLDACAARAMQVEQITLDVLQAARDSSATTLLWCDDEHVALLQRVSRCVRDLRVVRLATGLGDEAWCRRVCDYFEGEPATETALAGCSTAPRLALLREMRSTAEPAPTIGPAMLNGLAAFNLARGALASAAQRTGLVRTWQRVACTALIALGVLAAGLHVHRLRGQAQLERVADWERSVFMESFPEQPPPAGVALRLASERRRLEGLTMAGGDTETHRADALQALRTLTAALPADVRVDLQELRVESRNLTLRGRCRDHRQAERLAVAIDQLAEFSCPAPRTHRLDDGGVQFFLSARRADAVEGTTVSRK